MATIATRLDRHAWMVFGVCATACLVGQVLRARAKPFWHDEIYTILHSSLPSIRTLWQAAIDGFDLSPPLNTVLTRGVHSVFGVGPVATRVPPMLGYLTMNAGVFLLLKRRANTVVALSGTLLPYFTRAYPMAYEARAYGLMIGLCALSLLAWTEAARDRRRGWSLVLLAASLSASIWNHFYGILTFAPIIAGELVRAWHRRRVDIGVSAALAVALAAALPLWPLAATAHAQSGSFWAPATAWDLWGAYQFVLGGLLSRRAIVTAAVIAGLLLFASRPRSLGAECRPLPSHEVAAGVVALLIPAIGVAIGVLIVGVFTPRYVLSGIVGVSLVIPLAVWHRNTRAGVADYLLCAVLLVSVGIDVAVTAWSPPQMRDPLVTQPLLQEALASGNPVIVESSLDYLTYWYYAPASQKSRLRYLPNPEAARRFMGFDTIDRGYLAVSRWIALPVQDFREYVSDHREFRVYGTGPGWLLAHVAATGGTIEVIATTPAERLVRVRLDPEAGH